MLLVINTTLWRARAHFHSTVSLRVDSAVSYAFRNSRSLCSAILRGNVLHRTVYTSRGSKERPVCVCVCAWIRACMYVCMYIRERPVAQASRTRGSGEVTRSINRSVYFFYFIISRSQPSNGIRVLIINDRQGLYRIITPEWKYSTSAVPKCDRSKQLSWMLTGESDLHYRI